MWQTSAPTELLYNVIEQIWESPLLTPDERINFMIASALVSKGWSAMLHEISSYHLHIPCESFYHRVFACDTNCDFRKCKRLTFTVYDRNQSDRTLSYMRHVDIANLTSLNTVHINYYNSTFPDPYVQGFFSAIPDGLPKLAISYTFSPDIRPSVVEYHRRHFERKSQVRYAEPQIGTLEVNGADEYVAAVWESLFPTRERLIRDGRQETEPLLRVTSIFAQEQALLVRLADIQRQRDVGKDRRASTTKSDLRSVDAMIPVEADGLTFISSKSAFGAFHCVTSQYFFDNPIAAAPPYFPSSTSLGDVGYISDSSGTFVPLFNTFEPHALGASTIPSLYGYGNPKIQTKPVNTRSLPINRDGKVNWVKKIKSVLLKASKNMRYIDSNEGGAAANWFEQNVTRIVGAYGEQYGLAPEDIVLGAFLFCVLGP